MVGFTLAFWIWVIVAALFLVAEIFTAGFFLFPFGVGAVVAAVLTFFGAPKWAQWTVFFVVSIVVTVLVRRFAHKVKPGAATGIDRLLGQKGIVIEEIDTVRATGRVRILNEEWRARTEGDLKLPLETRVEVVRIDGNHVVVRPA